jgi:ABC-2 type transport system ATP-binding protein
MISIENLSKTYGSFDAVKDLNLKVPKGSVYAFLGPNGAGKTTTIRMLMGILVPSAGRAKIAGLDCIADRIEVKRRVGYLPDSPVFYDFLRGHEIIAFVGEMHGMSRKQARVRADDLIDVWALTEAGDDFAVNYSMGMKKKLGLACAMIHEPEVLILDEPTNGLDPRTSRYVQERLRTLASEGHTVFLSTHLLDMVERICDQACIIDHGRLMGDGSLQDLRAQGLSGGSLEDVFLKLTENEGPL